jgi:hypothetical protein
MQTKRGKWSPDDLQELDKIFQSSKSIKTALNKASRIFRRSKASCYSRYSRYSRVVAQQSPEQNKSLTVVPKKATQLVLSIKGMEIKDNKLIINL